MAVETHRSTQDARRETRDAVATATTRRSTTSTGNDNGKASRLTCYVNAGAFGLEGLRLLHWVDQDGSELRPCRHVHRDLRDLRVLRRAERSAASSASGILEVVGLVMGLIVDESVGFGDLLDGFVEEGLELGAVG